MIISLFGDSCSSAQALKNLIFKGKKKFLLNCFSRNKNNYFLDLDNLSCYPEKLFEKKSVWISFAPVWKLASFLEELSTKESTFTNKINMIIACSSSSVYTKRFATNKFDKELYKKLSLSEEKILKFSIDKNIKCIIIQPTLIYGNVGEGKDRNFNKILWLLNIFPFIFLPKDSGLRQPIHAKELANIILFLINKYKNNSKIISKKIALGGDITLSYKKMIEKIKESIPKNSKGSKCKIITLPNRIFYFIISPLIIISPKIYEAFMRISSDLSGFSTPKELTNSVPNNQFPVT